MAKEVKKGDEILVSVECEFEGTVRNHSILIESTFIPTVDNKRKNFPIKNDGDPIELSAQFVGVKKSKIKKFMVEINGVEVVNETDVIFKKEALVFNTNIPFEKCNLKEIK